MKKSISIFLTLSLVLVLGLMGCSNDQSKSTNSSNSGTTDKNKTGKTEVVFWHSLSGDNGKALKDMVEGFNKQSDSVHVKLVYQGSYEEMLTKIRASENSYEMPAIIQSAGSNRKFLADSDFVTPVQKFIDEDGFDSSSIAKNVYNYYKINNKLYSMPFNASNAILFYNKDMFKKAGLDPNNPPGTFEKMKQASKKIKSKTGKYGFTMHTDSWFFEELLANQNALYFNKDNGFSGDPTKALINQKAGLNIFKWLDDMNKAGTFKNYGSGWEDAQSPFFAGQVAMLFDSSADTRMLIKGASFDVGAARLPVPDGTKPYGEIVGGNSNYITNKVSEKKQKAAWKFLKYTISPKVQAKWASETGYFPVTEKANDIDVLKKVYKKYPQMKKAVEINRNSKSTPALKGPMSVQHAEAKEVVGNAQEKVYGGGDPKQALYEAAKKITDLLN